MVGLMAAGAAGPAWAEDAVYGAAQSALDQYSAETTRPDAFDDVLGKWVDSERLADTVVIITPGTDDTGLQERTAGLLADRNGRIVTYPQSLWPITSGTSGALLPFLAPTYDESKGVAVDANLAIMRAFEGVDRVVVYTGYSQGADALGDAAESANGEHLLNENSLILLVSDPRGPWGLKAGLADIPLTGVVMALIGAKNDGARDPAATGDAQVVQVIVKGDPVANWQWDPLRPVSSLLVDLAGFITIHAGTGPYSYANLGGLELEKTLYSAEGNTTYEVYDTYHPLALLPAMISDALGIDVPKERLEEWDRQAELFYPLQDVSPETAAPGASVVTEQQPGRHRLIDGADETTDGVAYQPRHALPDESGSGDSVIVTPETEVPETVETESVVPETVEPETTEPETTEPETVEPETPDPIPAVDPAAEPVDEAA